jgi:hypothetical protein
MSTTRGTGKSIADFTLDDCYGTLDSKFKDKDGTICYKNPSTGAKIKKNGPKYNEIMAHCKSLESFVNRRSSSSSSSSSSALRSPKLRSPTSPRSPKASESSLYHKLSSLSISSQPFVPSTTLSSSSHLQKHTQGKTAIFTYGRFQPATIGHALLINSIVTKAYQEKADHYIFVSMSTNKKFTVVPEHQFVSNENNQNPLNSERKVYYMRKMFPYANIIPMKSIKDLLAFLYGNGYTRLIMMIGSDRMGAFNLKNVEKIGVGESRDSKASGVKGMSGTKMRMAAVAGDYEAFRNGVMIGEITENDVKCMMNEIREGLGYKKIHGGFMGILQYWFMGKAYKARKNGKNNKKKNKTKSK